MGHEPAAAVGVRPAVLHPLAAFLRDFVVLGLPVDTCESVRSWWYWPVTGAGGRRGDGPPVPFDGVPVHVLGDCDAGVSRDL